MSTARIHAPHPQPATAEELLDHEESLAIQRIAGSVQRLGDDLVAATDLRRRIRRYPWLATGLGALLGFVGGPLLPRALERMLTMMSSLRSPASRRPHALLGLVLNSLRVLRPRR